MALHQGVAGRGEALRAARGAGYPCRIITSPVLGASESGELNAAYDTRGTH